MNHEQYDTILKFMQNRVDMETVHIREVQNPQQERTLIYGYTPDRHSFHVYVENELIHNIMYSFDRKILMYASGEWHHVRSLIPTKRVYPAASDFDFCMLLVSKGYQIPFTGMDDRIENQGPRYFWGLTKKNLDEMNNG